MSFLRSSLKQSGSYAIATIASKLASFLLLPLYTHFLSPKEYGILDLLALLYSIFTTVVGTRIGDSLFYFFFEAPTEERRCTVVSSAYVGGMLVGLVVSMTGWLCAPLLSQLFFQTTEYASPIRLYMAAYAFAVPAEVGFAHLRALNRSSVYTFVSIVKLCAQVVLNLVFLMVMHLGFVSILWTELLSNAGVALFLAGWSLSSIPLRFHGPTFWRHFRYALPFSASGAFMIVIHSGDRLFLQRYSTLEEVGLYALAYKLGMMVEYSLAPFALYWNAQVFSILLRADGERIYVRVCTYVIAVLACVALAISFFARPGIELFLPRTYWRAAPLVPIIAFAYVFRALDQHFRTIFRVAARTGREAQVIGAGCAVCVALYWVLIPRFQMWGAAVATLLTFAGMTAYSLYRAQRVRHFNFEFGRLFRIAAIAAALLTLHWLIGHGSLAGQLLSSTLLVALYPSSLWLWGFFDDEEKTLLRARFAMLIRRPEFAASGTSA